MFLESIGYTATLIKYVAMQTGKSVQNIASTLGLTQVFDLCHNAPMNRLLPIEQIAREIISDNYLTTSSWIDGLVADYEYGSQIEKMVYAAAHDKYKYVDELYTLLIRE